MHVTPVTDETLIATFRSSGDRQILDALVGRHVGRVRAMIYAMVLSDADADDLTQEVFVRAIRNLDGFRGQAQFPTWLHRIAMNTVRTFLGRRDRHASTSVEALEASTDCRASAPEEAAMANEVDGDIALALASLAPKLRAAVTLTTLHGMSPQEAAKVENCPVATMHWRVHKARTILKKKLAGHLK